MAGFQIKDFVSIAASMMNHAKATQDKLTDFEVGSVARTMMEAPAIEIEELYVQMFNGLMAAIPVATFLSFGFGKRPAAKAHGYVTVTADAPLPEAMPVPAGTEFIADNEAVYLLDADEVWPAGESSLRVKVTAALPGLAGNIGAGRIVRSDFFPDAAVSSEPMTAGRDEESDDEQQARFADFVASISRGTDDALRYAVSQVVVGDEYVTRVGSEEGGGHVRLYLYSSAGVPSAALLAKAQQVVDGYYDEATGARIPGFRAAGVRVDILPMAEKVVTIRVRASMLPGYSLTADVINDMRDQFGAVIGQVESGGVLFMDTVVERLLSAPGVHRVVPRVDENVPCGENEVLVPGVLTVEALNE